jgi:CHAT domain-containing protein/tetratricopeptide (TPR) repeat protein
MARIPRFPKLRANCKVRAKPIEPQRLDELLDALLAAEPAEKHQLLEAEAEVLLHRDAEALLRRIAERAKTAGDLETSRYFTGHADLLAICRKRGVAEVFAAAKRASIGKSLVDLRATIAEKGMENELELRQRQVGLCRRILAQLSRQDDAEVWAGVQGTFGVALHRLGELTEDSSLLDQAVLAFHAALLEIARERSPSIWAATQNNLGNVLRSLSELVDDPSVLRQAAQAYGAALLEYTREHSEMDWTTTQENLSVVLARLGDMVGDASVLRQAEQALRAVLLERTRERAPIEWPRRQNDLGNILQRLGGLIGDTALLEQAVAAYRLALAEFTRERALAEWAATHNNLGTALRSLGEMIGDASMLRQAEQALDAVLLEDVRERAPEQWAMAQNNLGSVLLSLCELTGDTSVLRQAEQAHRAALLEFTRAQWPMKWATTQNNLGAVLACAGELTGDTAVLRQAEQAHGAALLEFTRERAPRNWARTQSNLGDVLLSLGELTGDPSILRLAKRSLNESLLETTRERAPREWARTQSNLGNVLTRLGELTGNISALRQAEQAHRAALLEFTREHTAIDWAATQTNYGTVLQQLGDLSGDTEVLRRAEQAYQAALLEYTRERAAMRWAAIQSNIGGVLSRLGDLTGDAAQLEQAAAACRLALEEFTRTQAPMRLANTYNNLGGVLARLGNLTADIARSEEAVEAYRLALAAMNASGAEDGRQGTASALAQLLVRLGRYEQAIEVIVPALARSDAALLDAARSRDGTARAVERVGGLFGLLSLCQLRQDTPDRKAALIAAESGRARLLADALALDAVRPDVINDPNVRTAIEAARNHQASLRYVLGYTQNSALASDAMTRCELEPAARERLQADLRQAIDAYVVLCRVHGLIRTPEPLSFAEITAAAPEHGALVLPVLTEASAFAFVVTRDMTEPLVIDLPHLNRHAVADHLSGNDGWLGVYSERFRRADKDAAALGAAEARWRNQLTATLARLWEQLLGPLHRQLSDTIRLAPEAPVIMLAPGLLGLLPLHAAGPGPDGLHFGDHWTVSYAPSVRTLLTCRRRQDERQHLPAKLLAAIDPPSEQRLLGARQEAPMLRQHFAHAEQVILEDTEATLGAVLEHLPSATCFHASTHGWHDSLQPTQSGLHLADAPLLLDALHDTKLDAARLVFLSACESGLAEVRRLPEEFIGLSAGFVQAGAACVVASLWPIRDDAAFLLAGRFYGLHLDEQGRERLRATQALRQAQDWLRRLTFADLRQLFPVVERPDGPYLHLQTSLRFETTPPAEREEPNTDRLLLPLGPDTDTPYAHPQHWAAFTATGA